MSEPREQRHFTRIPFDAEAALVAQDGRRLATTLLDISLKGALVDAPDGWVVAAGTPCRLEVLLGPAPDAPRIRMQAQVAHAEAGRVGLRCEHIDLDSVMHLRRLMELNLGNERLLERELSELAALSRPPGPPPGG